MVKGINKDTWTVATEALSPDDSFITITQAEFMRRMQEMQMMNGMGKIPGMSDMYQVAVNSNHPLATKIVKTENEEAKTDIVKQAIDLAKLQQNLLTGEELANFIKRSEALLGA